MINCNFKEANTIFAKGNKQLETHSWVDNSINGNKDIVSCYSVSFFEALLMMVTGKIWVNVTSFSGKLHPMRLSSIKKDMILTRKQALKRDKDVKAKEDPADPSNNGMYAT